MFVSRLASVAEKIAPLTTQAVIVARFDCELPVASSVISSNISRLRRFINVTYCITQFPNASADR